MFTGLIEDIGVVRILSRERDGMRVGVETALPLSEVAIGDSIAVNGACLTAVTLEGRRFTADVSRETLARTNLGGLAVGERVHLERALRFGDRLGGHLVQGHVDAIGTLAGRTRVGTGWEVDFDLPESLLGGVVEKGSIALDGVSLTVARLDGPRVTIAVVPHTTERTTFMSRPIGAAVNVETDMLGKYVARSLERMLAAGDGGGGIDMAKLRSLGFAD